MVFIEIEGKNVFFKSENITRLTWDYYVKDFLQNGCHESYVCLVFSISENDRVNHTKYFKLKKYDKRLGGFNKDKYEIKYRKFLINKLKSWGFELDLSQGWVEIMPWLEN